ncbi:hypothetical protein ACH4FX_42795 [Streptomyces sp. NPDC018019]|uniref:hypothetical protein n=1 Tax=Streptomyces sp. NPDC018019 TaxID=3365030 RepID=UPI0037BDDA0E
MAEFLMRQYRIVSGRLEAEQLRATRQALVVVGDALTAVGTAATWGVLVLLVATGRMELAAAAPPPSRRTGRSPSPRGTSPSPIPARTSQHWTASA